ncbi:MAG: hypothetical protein IKV99_01180 [Oscillospiraceae bacterium]|nr:hypothetical protein [Oscillospiraceae bacterium]
MKRFFALVLSLVMALSLCTPAWGAEGTATEISTVDGLKAALAQSGEYKLTADLNPTEAITVPSGVTVVLDMNGKTIAGTNSTTNTHNDLFLVKGTLTVNGGTITQTHAAANMGWNGCTNTFDITAGGVLNLNGVTVENLGSTDMNFAVHMNNWGEVTLNVQNSYLKATYMPVRVFNSGPDMNNVTIKNSTLDGGNHSFWVHNYASADFGGKVYSGASAAYDEAAVAARLNFDIYGNGNTFITGKPYPVRYGFNESLYFRENGEEYGVASVNGKTYKTLAEAVANLKAGDTLTLLDDIALSSTVNVTKSVTIDGNGHKITNAGTTTNTAFMLGDSTWHEDKVDTCSITLKNAIFDSWETDHVVRVQGVKATIDNCTFQNCTSANVAFGVVTLNYAEATVQNCTFTDNNCAMVVNVNYSVPKTTVLTKSNTIDNCVFTENTVSGVSVVYYSQGGGFVCKNSEFTKNVVNTSSHAAVVYGEVMTVTGNTFTENSVTATSERAGVVVADGGKVNENVFSNNTLSSAKYEATVVSKGDGFALDLNANYWGDGSAPAEGVDYVNAKPDKANTITATTYYSAVTADGKLSGLVDPNAPKPPVYNPTVTPETPTEKPVETPTETPTQTPTQPAPSTEVTVGGSESAVKVEATVTGTTATIDKIDTAQMETAIDSAADTGKVTIDFSAVAAAPESGEENAVVDTVEIPVEVIAQIAEAVADPENKTESLEIVLGDGASIEFDAAALAEKVAQAGGESIEISIKPTTAVSERLSSAQLFAVGESVAYDITVTSGGVAISDMGGNITITAPYALAEGETAEGIVVYYVDDEGNREKCETTYDAATGRVSWVTNHLSVYMVAYEAPAADDGATDDGAVSDTPVVDDAQSSGSPALWIIIVVVVIVAIVVVVIISKKRKA